jgi:hypothetical protein
MDDDRFAYDTARPLALEERSRQVRDGATIHDVTFLDGAGRPVDAFLVEPDAEARGRGSTSAGSRPGVLFAHWFEPKVAAGRSEFLGDAVRLAGDGVASVLPQLRFPWSEDPQDAAHDVAAVAAEVVLLRRALDLLVAEVAVDASRIAFAGHDFGAMHGTALMVADRRPVGYVLMAPVPRWGDWFLPFWAIAGDRHDYLRAMAAVDPIGFVGAAAPARVLFQFARCDFFIAPMTGLEFARVASQPSEHRSYETDHGMDHPDVHQDRLAFLRDVLQLDR